MNPAPPVTIARGRRTTRRKVLADVAGGTSLVTPKATSNGFGSAPGSAALGALPDGDPTSEWVTDELAVEAREAADLRLPIEAFLGRGDAAGTHRLHCGGFESKNGSQCRGDVLDVRRITDHAESASRIVDHEVPHKREVAGDHGCPGSDAFEELVGRLVTVVQLRTGMQDGTDIG
jgi:hypothetical protein